MILKYRHKTLLPEWKFEHCHIDDEPDFVLEYLIAYRISYKDHPEYGALEKDEALALIAHEIDAVIVVRYKHPFLMDNWMNIELPYSTTPLTKKSLTGFQKLAASFLVKESEIDDIASEIKFSAAYYADVEPGEETDLLQRAFMSTEEDPFFSKDNLENQTLESFYNTSCQ